MVTQKEAKEKEKISRTETGKFFYDLSKSTFTMVTGCIISLCILGWLYTKPGQKWLDGFK